MHLIIQHDDGKITGVRLGVVSGQLRRSAPVAFEPAKAAAYLAANAGKSVTRSEFESATHRHEQRLLLVVDGAVVEYPLNTLVLVVSKLKGGASLLVDLLQTWRMGKYCVVGGAVALTPSWVEPRIEIPAG